MRTLHLARFGLLPVRTGFRAWKPDDGGEKWFCGDCGS
jgi:hypothetical protein